MMPFRSHARALVSFVLLLLAVPVSANEIKLSFDGFIGSYFRCRGGCTDNSAIITYPGSSEVQSVWGANAWGEEFWYNFPTFAPPIGATILSAKLTLSFAHELEYSYEPNVVDVLPQDPNLPSLPGRMLANFTTHNAVVNLLAGNCEMSSSENFLNLDLMQQGCNPLTNGMLEVSLFGSSLIEFAPIVLDPGLNATTLFLAEGGGFSPLHGELDVVYTPEPLSLALLGSGMVLMAGVARRRGTHGKSARRI